MDTSVLGRLDSAMELYGNFGVNEKTSLDTAGTSGSRRGRMRIGVTSGTRGDSFVAPRPPNGVEHSRPPTPMRARGGQPTPTPPTTVGARLRNAPTVQTLMRVTPGTCARESGLRLPPLGQELALLTALEEQIFPSLLAGGSAEEWASTRGAAPKKALWALRDELTRLEMARNFVGLGVMLDLLNGWDGDTAHAPAVRAIRCELLLYVRRRRSLQRGTSPLAARPELTPLERLEHRLVADLVRETSAG